MLKKWLLIFNSGEYFSFAKTTPFSLLCGKGRFCMINMLYMQQLQTWSQCEKSQYRGPTCQIWCSQNLCQWNLYTNIYYHVNWGQGEGPHTGMHSRLFLDTSKLFPPFSLAFSTKASFAHKGAQFEKYYMHKTVATSPKLSQSWLGLVECG